MAEVTRYRGGWLEQDLVELIYDPVGMRTRFVIRDGLEGMEALRLERDGVTYEPAMESAVKNGLVKLPSALGKAMGFMELHGQVKGYIQKEAHFGNELVHDALAFYAMMTWVYDGFETVPLLWGHGNWASRTRLMEVMEQVCYRGTMPATCSRHSLLAAIHYYRGTLVVNYDEYAWGKKELQRILDLGVWRGKKLTVKGAENLVSWMEVFGPKVVISGGQAPADLRERCVTVALGKMKYMQPVAQSTLRVRNALLTWRMLHALPARRQVVHGRFWGLPVAEATMLDMLLALDPDEPAWKAGLVDFGNRWCAALAEKNFVEEISYE